MYIFPIQDVDFPLLCLFTTGYLRARSQDVLENVLVNNLIFVSFIKCVHACKQCKHKTTI